MGSLRHRGDREGVPGGNSRGAREHRWQCTKRAFTQRFLHTSFLKRRMIIMVERDGNDPWLGSRGEMKKERDSKGIEERGVAQCLLGEVRACQW